MLINGSVLTTGRFARSRIDALSAISKTFGLVALGPVDIYRIHRTAAAMVTTAR